MNTFGLDIGTNNTKIVSVFSQNGKGKLLSSGCIPTPAGGFSSEAENDIITLATAIKKLHQDLKIPTKKVVISLPEIAIFSKVIEVPKMTDEELSQAIPWEAEQFIPVPIQEVTIDWQVVVEKASQGAVEKIKVFVVAAPNSLIQKYQRVMEEAAFELEAIETESVSVARSLVSLQSPPTMIVDLGAKSTDIVITNNGQVLFTRSIPTAGDALTRALSTSLSMDLVQAEQYKIAYGLEEKQLEGKVRELLFPIVDIIFSEIKKSIAFWNEKESVSIKNIILCGGTSELPGLVTYLTKSLGIEVQIADPFKNFTTDEKTVIIDDKTNKEKLPLFPIACGLALKEI